ncbi:hypothetical protein [Nocardiopsis metallicus]|uniref:Apolipoprotein N-acyltransferase n=1 Tax=Nocardiopsis metallicus TaxID=179819 RepID=A0A840WGC7_9ACTN|nr:hypothetical protein [Nocardiopsis metallicus]MBB5490777.1 apolipoprotein N-acyltransferase [Nocardiopsis metallicus]
MNAPALSALLAGAAVAASLVWALVAFKYGRPVLGSMLGLAVVLVGSLVAHHLGDEGRTLGRGFLLSAAPSLLCLWTVLAWARLGEHTESDDTPGIEADPWGTGGDFD